MVNTDFNQFRKKTLLLSRALHPRPMDATVITGHLARSLDRVAAVSFDIFDTLTTRLVYHPVDVFKFLPDQPAFKALQLPDTVDIPAIRVKAEHATYEAVNKETGNSNANLREIYRTFCEMVGKKPSDAEALVSAEEEVELMLAIPNEDGRLLFDEVRRRQDRGLRFRYLSHPGISRPPPRPLRLSHGGNCDVQLLSPSQKQG